MPDNTILPQQVSLDQRISDLTSGPLDEASKKALYDVLLQKQIQDIGAPPMDQHAYMTPEEQAAIRGEAARKDLMTRGINRLIDAGTGTSFGDEQQTHYQDLAEQDIKSQLGQTLGARKQEAAMMGKRADLLKYLKPKEEKKEAYKPIGEGQQFKDPETEQTYEKRGGKLYNVLDGSEASADVMKRLLSPKAANKKIAEKKLKVSESNALRKIEEMETQIQHLDQDISEDKDAAWRAVVGPFDELADMGGPIGNILRAIKDDAKEGAIRKKIKRILDGYRKAITGAAASFQELNLIKPSLPQLGDTEEVFLESWKDYKEAVRINKEKIRNHLASQGRDISAIQTAPDFANDMGDTSISQPKGDAEILQPRNKKDEQALKWAKSNPNDPRAKRILELQGQK